MLKKTFVLLFLSSTLFATDYDYTWAGTEWNTPWTDYALAGSCDDVNTFSYDSANGNPTYSRNRYCQGRNDNNITRYIEWSGTWEDLGVTPGDTVSTVQMLDLDTKLLTDTNCSNFIFGPFELRDSIDTLVATLWTGRQTDTAEGSFTAEGAQSAQSVGSLSASDSTIHLRIVGLTQVGNSNGSICEGVFDNLDIRIVAAGGTSRRVMTIQ